ncbi:hypothetical protein GLW08_17500 [Pontibacillus yanchengensis]|uniref:Uncharacterized protein n=2 Tax=Pontibacillus yanchengensis TaxID=462910 RepID=A0ACC7VJJ2_9BACI|nr:hypothetical protein [Pontibacillus yanchengensis]MYL32739.1 hypothetical protein [Pontibacillus yanchengensis]MYL55133.1 hypothetical protein [Pontibacillus yanchengensis]
MSRKFMLMIVLIPFILTGCLYPDENLTKNQVPNTVQLQSMQTAIDQFKESHPYELPIKNREKETPVFQKYPIDFSRLKEANILAEAPGNSFQRGGVYQYVLIHPEEDPTVKVIDIRATQNLTQVNIRLAAYRNEHRYPPFGEKVADDIYTINYKKLGYDDPPQVKSPYTQNLLPIVMDVEGDLYIDYRPDLYDFLQKYEHNYKTGDDIRYLLAEHSPIVPANSLPYTIKDGEPVFDPNINSQDAS